MGPNPVCGLLCHSASHHLHPTSLPVPFTISLPRWGDYAHSHHIQRRILKRGGHLLGHAVGGKGTSEPSLIFTQSWIHLATLHPPHFPAFEVHLCVHRGFFCILCCFNILGDLAGWEETTPAGLIPTDHEQLTCPGTGLPHANQPTPSPHPPTPFIYLSHTPSSPNSPGTRNQTTGDHSSIPEPADGIQTSQF